MITLCEDCDNLEAQSAKSHPRTWICRKFPRLDGKSFLSETYWGRNEPFMRCEGINGGACPLFTPRPQKEALANQKPE